MLKSSFEIYTEPIFNALMVKMDSLISNKNVEAKTQQEQSNESFIGTNANFERLSLGVLIAGIALFLGTTVIAVFTTLSITKPVQQLKKILVNLGRGVFPKKNLDPSNDEIGEMTVAMNSLVKGLQKTTSFAQEVGQSNFNYPYKPLSSEDILGHALLKMKDSLAETERTLELKVKERTEEVVKQKDEIDLQKSKLEELYKDVTDSIKYAKRLQDSILPPKSYIEGLFPDSFVLFKPKDIVSGDSYVPMRKDILLGADYLLLEKKNKLNISFSRLFGLGKRFLETNLFKVDLPEPYQVKIDYKSGKNFNFFSSLTKDSNEDYDTFNMGMNKTFSNQNFSSLNFTWIRNINSYIFENDEKRNIRFLENKNKIYLNERTSFHSKIEYDLKNSNLSNLVLGIEYENPGLIFGLALIESNELDWFKLINENTFNEYNRESFRIYFELKGLGSLGRKINQYTDRKLIQ
mgnify:CR=1 FL=1